MRLFDSLRFRIVTLFHRSQMNTETEEEFWSHIRHRADDLERSGLRRAEAERRARIEFGGFQKFKEECRETVGVYFLETLVRDLRLALHRLGKSPGFTVVAIGTLALAIGANVVVFSVMNALILRPLNVPHDESLYGIERASDKNPSQSYPDYLALRDRNRTFDGLAAFNINQVGLDTGENPVREWVYEVSGNYFDVLGIRPYLGRFFHASDEHGANSAPYIVLSYDYWHSFFHKDRGAVGRTVRLDKHPYTIIGVAPPGFRGTILIMSPAIFVPMVNQEQLDGVNLLNSRTDHWVMMVIGHPKKGVTKAQAIADLNTIGAYLEKTYPKDERHMSFTLARPGLLGDQPGGPIHAFLAGLMLLAALILLAGCTNLGSLFAARTTDRSREIALRLALGAGRLRILRHIFTEAILVSVMGGALGLWGSVILLGWLSVWNPFPQFPANLSVNPDAHVYGFALLLALATGFLFGAIPVRPLLRTDPYGVIKSGSTGTVGRRITVSEMLLGVQIAICAVLVTSALVAVRGLALSLHANFGFEPRNAMLINTDPLIAGYRGDSVPAMQRRMLDSMETISGVRSVGLVGQYPPLYAGWNSENVFSDKTADLRPSNAAADAGLYSISPDYFQAAGTTLLSGRTLTWHDDKNAPRVAVINQEFARKVFASITSAPGGYFKMRDGTRVQVVGIIEDGKYNSLTEDPTPAMFLPTLQSPSSESYIVVRSSRDPQQVAVAI